MSRILLLLLLGCLLMPGYAPAREIGEKPAAANGVVVDEDYARMLVTRNLGGGDYAFVDGELDRLREEQLLALRRLYKTGMDKFTGPSASLLDQWLARYVAYAVDDRLGLLAYDTVLEGSMGEMTTTLFGAAYYGFLPDRGEAVEIFMSPATIIPAGFRDASGARVRLFIRTNRVGSGFVRREVVKAESLEVMP